VTQFISAGSLQTTLQVHQALKLGGEAFEFARPASLSTEDPNRTVHGNWKTPFCRQAEAELSQLRRQTAGGQAV
jgi:glutamate synthase domain-containing protein 2